MSTFLDLWNIWAHLFRPLPYGDPYVAAFVLVMGVVVAVKAVRSGSKYAKYV